MASESLRELIGQMIREAVTSELHGPSSSTAPAITVSTYAAVWLAQRRQLRLVSVDDDDTRLRLHVLPVCGELVPAVLAEWRPKHVRALILQLRAAGKLSPRTIRHVYAVLSNLFRCAVADELLPATPCVLPRGVVPPNVDRDPEWRARAVFTRAEVEALISDSRIIHWRRVLYALKAVAGLRHTEAATLRWGQIDPREPLSAILLGKTKAKRSRAVPIHATLDWILARWRVDGFPMLMHRAPRPDDLVVPARNGRARRDNNCQRALLEDLARLGWRRRRGHDLRRTMISLARADGADRDKLKAVTHGPSGEIMDVYTTWPWEALCAEICKLRVAVRRGRQEELPLGDPAAHVAPASACRVAQ